MIWDWIFWIAMWWMMWFHIFIIWYSRQMINGVKTPINKIEAFGVFILCGFVPIFVIILILREAFSLNNRDDKDK